LQQRQLEIEAELSGDFQFIARDSDTLLQVKGEAGRLLALTELQTYYDPHMSRRLAAYAALAREKYREQVYVTVLYLLPPPAHVTPVEAFHEEALGQVAHQDFRVIPVWELEAADALALDNPALLPFVPLMRGGATVETLMLCTKRIHREPEAAELEVLLSIFASLVMDLDVIRQIVRWDMNILLESPVYQELLKEGYQKGLQEGKQAGLKEGRQVGLQEGRQTGLKEGEQVGLKKGRQVGLKEGRQVGLKEGRQVGLQEGEQRATLKALWQILTIRFDTLPAELEHRLERLDLPALQQLTTAALTLPTLPEFEQQLAKIETGG
jgi:predicted transposase YdaD